ncbi:MAG: hypothetical protein M0Z53_14675 [Thermaerobacter sp.]|nr:hypothetical protein [Thermaerobacter sp.]
MSAARLREAALTRRRRRHRPPLSSEEYGKLTRLDVTDQQDRDDPAVEPIRVREPRRAFGQNGRNRATLKCGVRTSANDRPIDGVCGTH